MNYILVKDTLDLIQEFNTQNTDTTKYPNDINGFKHWILDSLHSFTEDEEPDWEGKENGRSPESVINTFIVHMNRYAKRYSKSAIHNSNFTTQEDFIYLINLKAFGAMSKMELIKKNIQDKSVGMQIINRLIQQEWVDQTDSEIDKRSKLLHINEKGLKALDAQMDKIRQATQIVTGNLSYKEKMELIRLLQKLNDFHHPLYFNNIDISELLDTAVNSLKLN